MIDLRTFQVINPNLKKYCDHINSCLHGFDQNKDKIKYDEFKSMYNHLEKIKTLYASV